MDSVKRNTTIDIIRIIASFFVLICHVQFPMPLTVGSMAVARFAVPFFCMVSGWFLISPDDSREANEKRIKKSLLYSARLCIMGIILYSIVNSIICLIMGKDLFYWLFARVNLETIFELVVFNYAEFINPIMWYPFAYVYVLLIILAIVHNSSFKKAYFLIPVLLVANLVLADVFPMLRWYHLGNWLFTVLPFMLLGNLLGYKKNIFDRISVWILWISILSGVVMVLFESLFYIEHIIYVGTLFMVFGVFGLAIKGADKSWPAPLSEFGWKCTPTIFLGHFAVRNLFYSVFGQIKTGVFAYLMPFIVYIITSLIAVLIVIVKKQLPKKAIKTAR